MAVSAIVPVICMSVIPSLASSSSSAELSCPCRDPFSHCDEFENRCVACKDICEIKSRFADCQEYCPQYLQTVIFRHTVQKDDLKTLTVMVALTAAMTCVVMLAVFVLISMKMKKKNRSRKKILPTSVFTVEKEKVDIDLGQKDTISDNLVIKGSTANLPTHRPSFIHGTSMNTVNTMNTLDTMVTQLSQESSFSQPSTDKAAPALTNSRRASGRHGKTPRRLPSEDCIPEVGGRCNIAMSPVPGDQRGREYSVSHSQVV